MLPRFSPDGKLLTFVYCARGGCRSVIYDMSAGTYTSLEDSEGRLVVSLSFSPSGKKVVAVVNATDPATGKNTMQLAVGSLEDRQFKIITHAAGLKITPTFWNEETVIYWHAEPVPDSKYFKFRTSLRAIDLADGKERILHFDQERFRRPSAPNPAGDGEHIVFSDYCNKELVDPKSGHLQCTEKIVRMSLARKTKTFIDTGLMHSLDPIVAPATGKLYFKGRLEQDEGQHNFAYEVYVQDEKGVQRITYLRTYMSGFAVTPDGKQLAMVVREPAKSHTGRLLLLDVETGVEKILVPDNIKFIDVDIQ